MSDNGTRSTWQDPAARRMALVLWIAGRTAGQVTERLNVAFALGISRSALLGWLHRQMPVRRDALTNGQRRILLDELAREMPREVACSGGLTLRDFEVLPLTPGARQPSRAGRRSPRPRKKAAANSSPRRAAATPPRVAAATGRLPAQTRQRRASRRARRTAARAALVAAAPDPIGGQECGRAAACRWIDGDPVLDRDWAFCGHPVLAGSSYCAHHAGRASGVLTGEIEEVDGKRAASRARRQVAGAAARTGAVGC